MTASECKEWDAKLTVVARLMKAKEDGEKIYPYITATAHDAHLVFPYFETIMADHSHPEGQAAALHLITSAYFVVDHGHIDVPSAARDYMSSMEGNSKGANPLLENLDLVPIYRDYPHAIHRKK